MLHNTRIGRHAVVENAILDKNVVVPDGAVVGVDKEHDRARGLRGLRRRHHRRRQGPGGARRDDRADQASRPSSSVALLTREYPPEVYGGAGVHVEYLARELAAWST